MEILINTVMVICFIWSFILVISKIESNVIVTLFVKLVSFLGTVLPLIYLLKQLNII